MDTVFVLTTAAQEHQMSGQLGGCFDKDAWNGNLVFRYNFSKWHLQYSPKTYNNTSCLLRR